MSDRGARRAWQRMLSGRRLDLIDPSPLDVEIADIAHGLARVARWNGQTQGPEIFSVAQHSLLVEAMFAAGEPGDAPPSRLAALLHDAPEYVIGDMISPFKAAIGGDYRWIDARLGSDLPPLRPARALAPDLAKAIKAADRVAAYLEATALAGFEVAEARRLFGAPKMSLRRFAAYLEPMRPNEAEARFLARFAELDAAARGRKTAAEIRKPMPRLHVCSLALIDDTVAKTGARSLVTLLSPGTPVERPSAIAPERHLHLAISDIVAETPGRCCPSARISTT